MDNFKTSSVGVVKEKDRGPLKLLAIRILGILANMAKIVQLSKRRCILIQLILLSHRGEEEREQIEDQLKQTGMPR